MSPRYARIIRDARHRASSDALLLAALLAVALTPVPGLLLGGPGAPSALLHTLSLAATVFALPPFLLGGGFGTLLYLTATARERSAAIQVGSRCVVSPPSLIGASLLVAAVWGATGFALAAALSRAA